MDANENIYRKSLGKTLTNEDGLAMKEVVGNHTGEKLGATFFRGLTPIDAVWATSENGGHGSMRDAYGVRRRGSLSLCH